MKRKSNERKQNLVLGANVYVYKFHALQFPLISNFNGRNEIIYLSQNKLNFLATT
jgi:hypothetical protein